jgi:hypothetical protein
MVTTPTNVDVAELLQRVEKLENQTALAVHKFTELHGEIVHLIETDSIDEGSEEFDVGFLTGLEIARGIIEDWGREFINKNGDDNGCSSFGKEARHQHQEQGRITENILPYVQRDTKK